MRTVLCAGALLLLAMYSGAISADDREIQVIVADPYIDIHSGPGRGYPVFHVVEEGARVTLIKRQTQWIKVRTPRGREGWVHRRQLARTLDDTGEYVALEEIGQQDFFRAHGEVGVHIGEFDNATSLTVYGGYAFTENLQINLNWTEASDADTNYRVITGELQHYLFPRWRFAPYVMLGLGRVQLEPKTVLVDLDEETEKAVNAGLGLRMHLTRSFVLRTEYRNHLLLTSRNDNEEVSEWRAGFSVLF
jgi:uncharacterized protein YraI